MDNIIYIYCDGGCRGNQSKNNIGGWGVHITYKGLISDLYGRAKNTTNQKMELIACINGLKKIKRRDIPVAVVTDSQYVVKGITEWILKWQRNNWHNSKGEPVANKELWQELSYLKGLFDNISFNHCKGHANTEGNIKADRLANQAMDEVTTR